MSTRVVGGAARGRPIAVPAGTRPTLNLVREAVFDVLAPLLDETSKVVDLCAGSGAMGIEALSRGAVGADFVERSPAAAAVIRRNLAGLGFEDRSRVWIGDAAAFCRSHPEAVAAAAFVFLDPPYTGVVVDEVLAALDRIRFEFDDARVVVESPRGRRLPELRNLVVVWRRRYGDTEVTMLEPTTKK